jgi:predicted secreted protein
MKKIIFLILVLSIPLHYACKEKKVTYADNGKTIHLAVNQILRIELPGNASTGNDWRRMEYNDSVMIRKGKGNYMLGDGDPMMGESGIYHFKFLAINPGQTTLYMEYGNKYKNEKPAVKTYELDIVIISQ